MSLEHDESCSIFNEMPCDCMKGRPRSPFGQEGASPEQRPIEEASAAAEQVEEFEIPAQTAPVFPIETLLHNSACFFQRTMGGGMHMKVVALIATPNGHVPAPDATVVEFSAAGWDGFKEQVARDGARSTIETVRTFPGGMLNGSN